MQPKSRLELNAQSFGLLKRTIEGAVLAQRSRNASTLRLPDTLGIKLTNRCNLRCTHCYQWNEEGYHRHMGRAEQTADLDIGVFERVLEETRPVKSRLYLWGGEPLVHRQIGRILQLLEQDPRETTICTNAYFIHKHLDALCRISSSLEFLIALEGFEREHDALRGQGSYARVMGQIDELLRLRSEGVFNGKISVHSVINDGMIGRLYELMELFEGRGIDLVLLCFPWFISSQTSHEMDQFVADKFGWLIDLRSPQHSWDAFKYHLDAANIDPLMDDLRRINARTWKTKVRYQPGLEFDEIESFVRGHAMTARCARTCKVLDSRVDIGPSGKVSACKFFAEFSVGNLHESSLETIWQSEAYRHIRATFGEQLSPACSKCNVLYLHEHSTPLHI
jgi:radical SAM protein with 4Fe4S-binding SPASM domain